MLRWSKIFLLFVIRVSQRSRRLDIWLCVSDSSPAFSYRFGFLLYLYFVIYLYDLPVYFKNNTFISVLNLWNITLSQRFGCCEGFVRCLSIQTNFKNFELNPFIHSARKYRISIYRANSRTSKQDEISHDMDSGMRTL